MSWQLSVASRKGRKSRNVHIYSNPCQQKTAATKETKTEQRENGENELSFDISHLQG